MLTLSPTLVGKEIKKIGLGADFLVHVFFPVSERKSESLVRAPRPVCIGLSVREVWGDLAEAWQVTVLLSPVAAPASCQTVSYGSCMVVGRKNVEVVD